MIANGDVESLCSKFQSVAYPVKCGYSERAKSVVGPRRTLSDWEGLSHSLGCWNAVANVLSPFEYVKVTAYPGKRH